MDLLPAVDLREGRCVRLLRGDYDAEIPYDDDPVARAELFVGAGARWLHVVDLDAARTGKATNMAAIEAVCEAVGDRCSVEVGGGIRSVDDAQRLWNLGAARVVVGTAAVEQPSLVDNLVEREPGRVAVGVDARGRQVAVRGWTEESAVDFLDLVARFDKPGVAALVVTSIGRDGTMEGPDLGLLARVLEACETDVVASGGVGTVDDLLSLARLSAGERRLAGAIVGRALYEERFDLEAAVRAVEEV